MEIFQSNSSNSIPNQIHGITAIFAGLALSACTNTPPNHSYTPPQEETRIEYVPVYIDPPPTLVSKTYTHNGPLGDKICTYRYSNKEKIMSLCTPKQDKKIREYSKIIPGRTEFTPGKTEYGYGYGLQLNGKYGYGYSLQNIPPKSTYIPGKTVSCSVIQPFSQITGEALPQVENCPANHIGGTLQQTPLYQTPLR